MRTLLYKEIKNIMQEITVYDATNTPKDVSAKRQSLMDTMDEVLKLAKVARKEGLLSLAEEADKLEDTCTNILLKDIILLIVDGTEPGAVEEIGVIQFFTSKLHDYDALNYIMSFIGAVEIQEGINPRLIEKQMLAFLPIELADRYRDRVKQEEERLDQTGHLDMSEVYSLCDMFIGPALKEYKQKEAENENQLEKLFKEYKNRSNVIIP